MAVVDSAGNVYHQAMATYRGSGMSQAIYYASDIAAAPAGGNRVTVTLDRPAIYVDLRITEYTRVRHASPFDGGVSANGSSDDAATGSLTVPAGSELLFAAGMTGALFTGPGPGYTQRVLTIPDGRHRRGCDRAFGRLSTALPPRFNGGTWLLQLAACRAESALTDAGNQAAAHAPAELRLKGSPSGQL
jgi:hypothetical protein